MGGAHALDKASAAPPFASSERKRWAMSSRPAGPVALLLQSLGYAGLAMDEEFCVWGSFGKISIKNAPLHLFKSVILEEASNGVIRELATRRPQLAPVQGIDWHLTRPMWNRSGEAAGEECSQRHMLAFAAGGHWRQHHVQAFDASADTATCILCGQGRDDDEHLWHCTALRHIGEKHSMVHRCGEHLPVQLRLYGIAPHVCTDPRKAFWGATPNNLSRADLKWVGVGVGAHHVPADEDRNRLIQQGDTIYRLMLHHATYEPLPFQGWYQEQCDGSANAEGEAAGEPQTANPDAAACVEGEVPAQAPTVYTDGSVRPTRPEWLTTAGIGAYWPRDNAPIEGADWIAYWGTDDGTLKAAALSDDYRTAKCVPVAARQSSTRVEAQGILVAASHPGPQRIASDNVGAVVRWNQLLRAVRCDTLTALVRRKPWGMRPDGDVWSAAANLIARKGPDNIEVVWTKGHATDDDINKAKVAMNTGTATTSRIC